MYTIGEIEENLDKKQIVYLEKQDRTKELQATEYNFVYKDKNYFKSEVEALVKDINKAQAEQKNVYILVENQEKAKKICSILDENQILNRFESKLDKTIVVNSNSQIVTVALGKISSGFECFDISLLVVSANEII